MHSLHHSRDRVIWFLCPSKHSESEINQIYIMQDISVQAVLALGALAGAAATASYVPEYLTLREGYVEFGRQNPDQQREVDLAVDLTNDIIRSEEATAVSRLLP